MIVTNKGQQQSVRFTVDTDCLLYTSVSRPHIPLPILQEWSPNGVLEQMRSSMKYWHLHSAVIIQPLPEDLFPLIQNPGWIIMSKKIISVRRT